jgi:hypothetical protein
MTIREKRKRKRGALCEEKREVGEVSGVRVWPVSGGKGDGRTG